MIRQSITRDLAIGLALGVTCFFVGKSYYAGSQSGNSNAKLPQEKTSAKIAARFPKFKSLKTGLSNIFVSSDEAVLKGREMMTDFVNHFRYDPAGAIFGLSELEEPERSEAFKMVFGDPGPDLYVATLNVKYAHLPKGLLTSLQPEAREHLLAHLADNDPAAMAIMLSGGLGDNEERDLARNISILPSNAPENYPDATEVSQAFINSIAQLEGNRLESRQLRSFKAALTWLSPDQLVSTFRDLSSANNPSFWKSEHGTELLNRVLESAPNEIINFTLELPPDSEQRRRILETLSSSGDYNNLQRLVGDSPDSLERKLLTSAQLQHQILRIAQGNSENLLDSINAAEQNLGSDEQQLATQQFVHATLSKVGSPGSVLESLIQVDNPLSTSIAANLVSQWSDQDAVGVSSALSIALKQHGRIPDQVLIPFIQKIHDDPEAVILWASNITDKLQQQEFYRSAISSLQSRDPERAEWISNNFLDE